MRTLVVILKFLQHHGLVLLVLGCVILTYLHPAHPEPYVGLAVFFTAADIGSRLRKHYQIGVGWGEISSVIAANPIRVISIFLCGCLVISMLFLGHSLLLRIPIH